MKTLISILFFFNAINISYGQEHTWEPYQVDSLISVDFPGEVEDSVLFLYGIKYKITSSLVDNSIFMMLETIVEQSDVNKYSSKLPSDDESLEKTYKAFLKGVKENFPFQLKSEKFVDINNLKGLDAVFVDSLDYPVIETRLILLNKKMYFLQYMSLIYFDEQNKDTFFNSFKINEGVEVSQFFGAPAGDRVAYLIGEYSVYILMFVGLIVFIVRKMS